MLKFVIYLMAGTALAGGFVIAALTLGYDTRQPILIAAALGALAALPVAWVVGNKLQG
jgi:hypothetical protein